MLHVSACVIGTGCVEAGVSLLCGSQRGSRSVNIINRGHFTSHQSGVSFGGVPSSWGLHQRDT